MTNFPPPTGELTMRCDHGHYDGQTRSMPVVFTASVQTLAHVSLAAAQYQRDGRRVLQGGVAALEDKILAAAEVIRARRAMLAECWRDAAEPVELRPMTP